MKRLDIIVEGQSEREFITQTLAPYIASQTSLANYDISPIVVRTNSNSRGGMSKYTHLKNDILKSLSSSNSDLVVSMLIDYFRMPNDIAGGEIIKSNNSDYEKACRIETAISNDINDRRFIPYIQLHEFEAFLYTSCNGFEWLYANDTSQLDSLLKIVKEFPNPEDINTSPDGAPSKRIKAIIPEYNKVIDGNLIINFNGIGAILDKCPRFKGWTDSLIVRLNE